MILTKEIKVYINNKNISHYRSFGLEIKYGEVYDVLVEYVPKYSRYKVLVRCESCSSESEIPMQKYTQNKERSGTYNCKSCNNITYKKSMIVKYGGDNPGNIKSCIEKRKETCLEKYGSEYVVSSDYSKEKTIKTLIKRYGGHQSKVKNIMDEIVKKGKLTKIKNGYMIPDDKLTDWELYRRDVRRITEQNRSILLNNWDGIDYYDGEYIKDNFDLKHTNVNYPTLDHKISIIHGFKNDIDPSEIASLENICMTKRTNNSSKSSLTEYEYKIKNSII
jgi:hypothetical protein